MVINEYNWNSVFCTNGGGGGGADPQLGANQNLGQIHKFSVQILNKTHSLAVTVRYKKGERSAK